MAELRGLPQAAAWLLGLALGACRVSALGQEAALAESLEITLDSGVLIPNLRAVSHLEILLLTDSTGLVRRSTE